MTKIINNTKTKFADSVLKAISDAANASKNPQIVITGGIRLPEDQARIMAENLYNGKRISYLWAGQQIVAIFDANSKKLSKSEVIKLMEAKIIELAIKGQRVSAHCVTQEQYDKCNVIDISCRPENLPNPRDFVKELTKEVKMVKIITPFIDTEYKDSRVKKDKSEPCIHIEIFG